VRQDLKSKLGGEGAHIVSDSGNAREGFRLSYSAGKSRGSGVVDSLMTVDPETVTGPGARAGEVGIKLRLQIKEIWYKTSKRACRKL